MIHRPHSRLSYCAPREVAATATWKDHGDHLTPAA
jgi:hypothetical protein